jgi:hypothetical protein
MKEKILVEFINDHKLNEKKGISVVTSKDLSQLKSAGPSVEDLFDYLTINYKILLHGSRRDIFDDYLKQNEEGKIYGSDLAAIALMRGIISNRGLKYPGLGYPYFIDEKHPLKVRIHGINDETIGKKGFIYVINKTKGFKNNPKNSWQYVIKGQEVPIIAKVSIERSDFNFIKYFVFDITNNKRIQ